MSSRDGLVRRLKRQWQGHDNLRTKVERVALHLEKRYGIPKRKRTVDPLDTLIQTILSQNTNDRNRDTAYQRLKNRFPHWEDALSAKAREVISAIRPGGLAEQKARCIRKLLRWIKRHQGRMSLSFLKEMGSGEVGKAIGRIKGIGPKTINCLLLFGLGREAFPVDTHILRVGKRLGFIPEEIDAERAHGWMAPLIPKGRSLSLHLNLIHFGRSVCKAKNPQCGNCFLTEECLHLGYRNSKKFPLSWETVSQW
jgi:endonuclease-3